MAISSKGNLFQSIKLVVVSIKSLPVSPQWERIGGYKQTKTLPSKPEKMMNLFIVLSFLLKVTCGVAGDWKLKAITQK